MINPFELLDKKILVTGAASGIGKETAVVLSNLGARVILVDENKKMLNETLGLIKKESKAAYAFKIYENQEIEPQLKNIVQEQGAFDGLAYCAGIGGVRPLSITKHLFLQEMMNANVFSFIEFVRCITKKKCFVNGGSIVALSSISSIRGLKSKTAYCASKAALNASIRCMASELCNKGIRVNSILKGGVETDMHKDYLKNIIDLDESNDLEKQILGMIHPSEIANMIAFLLSDATKTITGTSLVIDGGYTL